MSLLTEEEIRKLIKQRNEARSTIHMNMINMKALKDKLDATGIAIDVLKARATKAYRSNM